MNPQARPVVRFFTWNRGLYFRHKFTEEDFINDYDNGEPWHCKDETTFYIKFAPKLFGTEDIYYDGHTVKSITLLGIEVGRYYSYDSRPAKDWTEEDIRAWREAKF